MAWIATAISVGTSIYGANQDKKAKDADRDAKMAGFNQYKPYVDANLAGASTALDGVLGAGAYTGQTYAGPNGYQTGTANTMGGYGTNMMGQGYGMMQNNSGFGQNSGNMYNQFQGMSQAAQADRLGNAINYASNNTSGLVDSAMRDDRRNLQENTLTGIDMAASGSGNANSSRAGIAEGVANRGYSDRQADMTSSIQNSLIDRSLAQQGQQFSDQGSALNAAMNANNGISSAYSQGLNSLGQGANFGMNAGNALQGYDQAQLTDQQAAFERQRDFELQQRMGYQSGILGQAPNSSQNTTPNYSNPLAAGINGAMQGFGFSQEYGPQIKSAWNKSFGQSSQG